MRFAWIIVLFALILVPIPGQSIFHVAFGATTYEYALFEKILAVTSEHAATVQESATHPSEARTVALVADGELDVACLVLTPDREARLLPIRIDVTRGVQGYRIFLIRTEDQPKFDTVSTLGDLGTRFTAGFGSQWGDLAALQANHLGVVTTSDTSKLYAMLEGRRFDYFPRGINEVWDNLALHRAEAPDIGVERDLALYYPLVQCFVVAPGRNELAARIEKGLKILMANGTMRKLFFQFYRDAVDKAGLKSRRIFELSNPRLPAHGPTVDRTWWLGRP